MTLGNDYLGSSTGVYVSHDHGNTWDKLKLNLPTVKVTDLRVKNGVIHSLDKVLLPANKNIVQTAQSLPQFSILVEAVVAANLQGALSGTGPLTVFAPTNDAFAALLTELNLTKAQLLANTALLTQVLTYHVVPGRVLKADVPPARSVNPNVPEELDKVLLKCLAKERDLRQADCKELAKDLENWMRAANVDVDGGTAIVPVAIDKSAVPNLPVHVVLTRGRLGDSATDDAPYRPQTAAASIDLEVEASKNLVKVELSHPEQARPGTTLDVTINLKDDRGAPLPGEVTLWLVDEAVLALAKEGTLDPLEAFIVRNARDASIHG